MVKKEKVHKMLTSKAAVQHGHPWVAAVGLPRVHQGPGLRPRQGEGQRGPRPLRRNQDHLQPSRNLHKDWIPQYVLESNLFTIMQCCSFSEPATDYELTVSGFTSKRTGSLSQPLRVTTDTAKSSPPLITEVNCTG